MRYQTLVKSLVDDFLLQFFCYSPVKCFTHSQLQNLSATTPTHFPCSPLYCSAWEESDKARSAVPFQIPIRSYFLSFIPWYLHSCRCSAVTAIASESQFVFVTALQGRFIHLFFIQWPREEKFSCAMKLLIHISGKICLLFPDSIPGRVLLIGWHHANNSSLYLIMDQQQSFDAGNSLTNRVSF